MSITELPELAAANTDLSVVEVARLEELLSEWNLIADLAFADLLLWLPTSDASSFVVAGQIRPATARSHIPDDLLGQISATVEHPELASAISTGKITDGVATQSHSLTQAIPVKFGDRIIAVLGRYSGQSQTGRLEEIYEKCVKDILHMVASGEFPKPDENDYGNSGRGGMPRVGDGLIILDDQGAINYASPNARQAFHRLGLEAELEGQRLTQAVTQLNRPGVPVDDTLSLIAKGRVQATAEVQSGTRAATLRSIPITTSGARTSTLVLVRDVTDLRRREQALLSKEATIREIHHRVKNNLQTVASLLRIQGRRLTDDSARIALAEAGRRVATIAVVHDLLAHNPGEQVNFDQIADRVVRLTIETGVPVEVDLQANFAFGDLPTDQATPLALVVAELVANCLEHGGAGRKKVSIRISTEQTQHDHSVTVNDDGPGIELPVNPEKGLGLPIIMTLVNDELHGTIEFGHNNDGEFKTGTRVEVKIPRL